MTEPTDAEAWEMWLAQPLTGHAPKSVGSFARAVLAKWGTPPAVAGEPMTARELADRVARGERWRIASTPQAAQAQAGAVPLTDEQIKEVMDLVSDWGVQSHLRGEAELDAHNPEATEDEITYAKECAEKERAAWNAIKDKLKPNGIKGGQHG